jgi:hypothetical protein
LRKNIPFDKEALDVTLTTFESKWVQKDEKYPNKPSGNAIKLSKKLFEKYSPEIKRN